MSTKYGTHKQREDISKQVKSMDAIQSDPYKFGSIENKNDFIKRKKSLEKQKEAITPPPCTDEERHNLIKRQEMLEAFIKLESPEIKKPAMPSKIEMWESPSGSRGKHIMWDKSVKRYTVDQKGNATRAVEGYGAVSEWKDNQRKLYGDAEADDPDIANIEQLRSQRREKSDFADYKRVTFGSTARYRQAYDDVFGKDEFEKDSKPIEATALIDSEAARKEEIRLARSERMKKLHAKKKAAKQAAAQEE